MGSLRRAASALAILTSENSVSVPEGGTATFHVKLKTKPVNAELVTVSRVSGDSDISVKSGAALVFSASNWNNYQTVTLAAAEDADMVDGEAMIRFSAPGLINKDVTATEQDNTMLPDERAEIVESFDGTSLVKAWYSSRRGRLLHRLRQQRAREVRPDRAQGYIQQGQQRERATRSSARKETTTFATSTTSRSGSTTPAPRCAIKICFEDASGKPWESDWADILPKMETPAADWENLVVDLTRTFSDTSGVDWTQIRKIKFMVEPGSTHGVRRVLAGRYSVAPRAEQRAA